VELGRARSIIKECAPRTGIIKDAIAAWAEHPRQQP
jgi:hypothetical protein